jgi:ssDNA-binding Zn-finger/Zn-ribbon topoisomerase 1|tara:strand:+ start:99 stop:1073 length:975 start_codon:yes stop_codon:yes gene_type:complete
MDIIDSKYIGLVSSRLQKFKRVKANLYNFRCPICGDSKKHKNKARGYFYQVKTNTNFKCHNCGASLSLNNFLKQIDSTLHKQYTLEKFKEGHAGGRNFVVEEPKFEFKQPVFRKGLDLPKASDVTVAKEYLEKRKLDPSKFYFTNKFKQWTNTQKKTFDTIGRDESRIIIPMYDENRNLIGFQGRSLGPNSVKYITVMINDDAPKIYGLDTIETEKPIYILEGPFDSTLVENSVAMCGSDIDIGSFGWSDYIWVFDNEPRNREIVNRISKTIDRGDKIVIWPSTVTEKDVNDMTMSGHNVMNLLESNTYSGLKAKIKFNNWKKI